MGRGLQPGARPPIGGCGPPKGGALPTILVQVATLDSLLESAGAARIDLIKIGTEGFEIDVFAGVKKTLGQYQPVSLLEIYS